MTAYILGALAVLLVLGIVAGLIGSALAQAVTSRARVVGIVGPEGVEALTT